MPVTKKGRVYNTSEWRRLVAACRVRDGGCVKRGGAYGPCKGRLSGQHVIPERRAPHLALDPRNVVTLCARHHGLEDGGRRY